MAGEWPTVPLGSLAANDDSAIAIGPFGSAMKADVYVPSGVPIIRGTNISSARTLVGDWVYVPEAFADAMPRCVVRHGDLVFPHRGSIGEVALVPGDRERYFLSTSCMKITLDRQRADPRYVAYYFKSEVGRAEIMRFVSQVGTPGIGQPLTSLRQFKVPAPPIYVQQAIANLLSSLDDKIELNRRMAETLEAMARALFESWFINFDPVNAKVERRSTDLSDNMAALFPDSFDEGGIPEGWANKADAIAELRRSVVSPEEVDPVTPYIGLEHLPRRNLIVAKWGKAEEVDSAKAAFAVGDLLFGKLRPYFHKVSIAPVNGICSSDIFVFRPRAGIPASFLYFSFSQDRFVENASNGSSGTRMPRADWRYMRQQPQVLPPPALLKEFDHLASPLIAKMLASAQESRALADLRDILLPKLISGELRIIDAERKISAA
jgi:type I restriction enzyme S subunit